MTRDSVSQRKTFLFVRCRILEGANVVVYGAVPIFAYVTLGWLGGWLWPAILDPGPWMTLVGALVIWQFAPRVLWRSVLLFGLESGPLGWPAVSPAVKRSTGPGYKKRFRALFATDEAFIEVRTRVQQTLSSDRVRWTWVAAVVGFLGVISAFTYNPWNDIFGRPLGAAGAGDPGVPLVSGIFGGVYFTLIEVLLAEFAFVLLVFCWHMGPLLFRDYASLTMLAPDLVESQGVELSSGQGDVGRRLKSYLAFWVRSNVVADVSVMVTTPAILIAVVVSLAFWVYRLWSGLAFDVFSVVGPLVVVVVSVAFFYLPVVGVHRLLRGAKSILVADSISNLMPEDADASRPSSHPPREDAGEVVHEIQGLPTWPPNAANLWTTGSQVAAIVMAAVPVLFSALVGAV